MEAMEEEARRAAADLAARLDRELRVGEWTYLSFDLHMSRADILMCPWSPFVCCLWSGKLLEIAGLFTIASSFIPLAFIVRTLKPPATMPNIPLLQLYNTVWLEFWL